jgi:SSS family solute:Na+ symporter
VRVGVISTLILMVFSVVYSPVIGSLGGIFQYFQAAASYLAVPVATVFLFGMFWKRATPAAANTIIIGGIPIGLVIHLVLIPAIFSEAVIERYSLDNFFVACGITQIVCSLIMYGVSLKTPSRPIEQIQSLLWKKEMFFLPKNEPRKPLLKSVGFWWLIFTLLYIAVYIKWW